MRLFTGDSKGNVGYIEVNYQTSECTGHFLMEETSSIVQLDYSHQNLIVSSHDRTVICEVETRNVIQIGQKPRKPSGVYGCAFSPAPSRPEKDIVYTARPRQRIWSANPAGEVQYTLIIKEIPLESEINLLNPSNSVERSIEKFSFGLLHHLGSSQIVSYNNDWLLIVDSDKRKVVGYTGKFRCITDVSVCGTDIFVLEGKRSLVCLSKSMPNIGIKSNNTPNPVNQNPLLVTPFKELGSKLLHKGTDLWDGLAKLGETVASKVSENTSTDIVSGVDPKINDPLNANFGDNFSVRMTQSNYELNSSNLQENNGSRIGSQTPLNPKMIQSFSNFLPSLISNKQDKSSPMSIINRNDMVSDVSIFL